MGQRWADSPGRPPIVAMGVTAAITAAAVGVISPSMAAAPDAATAIDAPQLRMRQPRGGGAPCRWDVNCGWYHPHAIAEDRQKMPSGNGARCLVGRCVCADEFEETYGCERCSLRLRPRFSYADDSVETTSLVRDKLGGHIDLCDLPTGGLPCTVGRCRRDEHNRTLSCTGDAICDAAGSGAGVCVGAEGTTSEGTCVCKESYFCSDCSLHRSDVLEGAECGRLISGGAYCRGSKDCSSSHGRCSRPRLRFSLSNKSWKPRKHFPKTSATRPSCKCDRGHSCRRCEHSVHELVSGQALCSCDAPRLKPNGGNFKGGRIDVSVAEKPWDSIRECEVRYLTQVIREAPVRPLFVSQEEAVAVLTSNGSLLDPQDGDRQRFKITLEFNDSNAVGLFDAKEGRHMKYHAMIRIYVMAVPRPNTSWYVNRSRVIRSKMFVLSAAHHAQHAMTLPIFALALAAALLPGRAPLAWHL